MQIITCSECGNQFLPNKFWQKYCSKVCNQSAYLKRKIAQKRKDPMDLEPKPTGPTEAQEAERERRTALAAEQQTPLDDIIRHVDRLQSNPAQSLDDLFGDDWLKQEK